MGFIKKLGLLGVVAATALAFTSASALADEIESSGVHIPNAVPGSGHVLISLASGTALYVMPAGGGQINCSTVAGEGTITRETVSNGATTEIGNIESLSFTDASNPECDSTIFGVSTCRITVAGLPLMIAYREQTSPLLDEVLLVNVEILFTCESLIGAIACHYTAGTVSGSITPNVGARNSAVFNDPFTGEASNSIICPSSGDFRASLKLNREASAGGGQMMITE
jgi:hypothetical protein